MRFYTKQYQYYRGIDLHTNKTVTNHWALTLRFQRLLNASGAADLCVSDQGHRIFARSRLSA